MGILWLGHFQSFECNSQFVLFTNQSALKLIYLLQSGDMCVGKVYLQSMIMVSVSLSLAS